MLSLFARESPARSKFHEHQGQPRFIAVAWAFFMIAIGAIAMDCRRCGSSRRSKGASAKTVAAKAV